MTQYGNRWGREGPPPEAYSRVTNAERFAPIHPFTDELVRTLRTTFDVDVIERNGLAEDLETGDLAKAPVRIQPKDPRAAPITIVYTAFPGVRVRFGRWHDRAFPFCGCDACDETAEQSIAGLRELVEAVTRGRFSEAIGRGDDGVLWLQHDLRTGTGESYSSGMMRLEGKYLERALSGGEPFVYHWAPWPVSPVVA